MPTRASVMICVSALASCLGGCSNRLFLHPSHDPIETGATRVYIPGTRFPLRRRTVEAFYQEHGTEGARPRLYVLAFTGNAGRAERELQSVPNVLRTWFQSPRALAPDAHGRRGVGVLAVNYPGFGSSDHPSGKPGPATLRRLGAAALDAYDHLAEQAQGAPIVVYGISMGTTAALHVAASTPEVPPAALVLDRGPDIPGLVMGRFGWWNLWLAAGPVTLSLPRATRSVANARRIKHVPALFVLGTRDTLVRPRNGARVANHYRGPRQVAWLDITHGSRVDSRHQPALDRGLQWLWDQIEPCPADVGTELVPRSQPEPEAIATPQPEAIATPPPEPVVPPSLGPRCPTPAVSALADPPSPPPRGLVDLRDAIPSACFDIRYASSDNFTGAPLPGYETPGAWMTPTAAEALAQVQADLEAEGLSVLVYDAYRPRRASAAMVQWAHDTDQVWLLDHHYIARHSSHARGTTVDLTVVDRHSGEPLEMGTGWDHFTTSSRTRAATGVALAHRLLLRRAMKRRGFRPHDGEWWHFTLDQNPRPSSRDVPYAHP